MSDNILVSIECITYNHIKYISQALDSILMQETDFKFEVIIHDDASTDGTTEIIKEYERRYPTLIHPIYQTENQFSKRGFTYISQLILKEVKGKYLAQCEGDDYWTDPHKLQKQVGFLESHPDYSMCFHQGRIHYEGKNIPDVIATDKLENREYTGLELYKHYLPITCSVVMRTEVLRSAIYQQYLNSSIPFGDLPEFLSCAHCGRIWGMTDNMAVYRKHSGGLTSVFEEPNEQVLKFFAEGHIQLYKIFGHVYKKQAIKIYVMEHLNFIHQSYQAGKFRGDLLKKILFAHPLCTLRLLIGQLLISIGIKLHLYQSLQINK